MDELRCIKNTLKVYQHIKKRLEIAKKKKITKENTTK